MDFYTVIARCLLFVLYETFLEPLWAFPYMIAVFSDRRCVSWWDNGSVQTMYESFVHLILRSHCW